MNYRKKVRLGDVLVKKGIIDENQLQTALSRQREQGKMLGEMVIALGYANQRDINEALCDSLGIDYLDMIKTEDELEIQRNELAEHFNCVPSQINYVISTRFKPSQGYYVESRRGGGGHITIKKVNNDKEDYLMHIINNIGKDLTSNEVDILLSDFLSYNVIDSKEAKLLKVATSDNVLKLSKEIKDEVRARIFKNMLLNL